MATAQSWPRFPTVGLVLVFFVPPRALDDARVQQVISSWGRLLEKTREPYGPRWFEAQMDRIHRTPYRDVSGDIGQAYAKTSLLAGA